MVITVLKGSVIPEKQNTLKSAFASAIKDLDAGIVETFLLSDLRNPNEWQILTVWKDQETLLAMRNSGETPRGILIFREADVEPVLSIYKVDEHSQKR